MVRTRRCQPAAERKVTPPARRRSRFSRPVPDPGSAAQFDVATAVRRVGDGALPRFDPPRMVGHRRPERRLSGRDRPARPARRPRRSLPPGPHARVALPAGARTADVEVAVTVERAGRGLTTLSARLGQGERSCLLAVGAFAGPYPSAADWDDAPPPAIAPAEETPPAPAVRARPAGGGQAGPAPRDRHAAVRRRSRRPHRRLDAPGRAAPARRPAAGVLRGRLVARALHAPARPRRRPRPSTSRCTSAHPRRPVTGSSSGSSGRWSPPTATSRRTAACGTPAGGCSCSPASSRCCLLARRPGRLLESCPEP